MVVIGGGSVDVGKIDNVVVDNDVDDANNVVVDIDVDDVDKVVVDSEDADSDNDVDSVAGSGTDRIGNVSIGDDVGMTTIDEADDISDGDS